MCDSYTGGGGVDPVAGPWQGAFPEHRPVAGAPEGTNTGKEQKAKHVNSTSGQFLPRARPDVPALPPHASVHMGVDTALGMCRFSLIELISRSAPHSTFRESLATEEKVPGLSHCSALCLPLPHPWGWGEKKDGQWCTQPGVLGWGPGLSRPRPALERKVSFLVLGNTEVAHAICTP